VPGVDQSLEVLYDAIAVARHHQRVTEMKLGSVELSCANTGFLGAKLGQELL
jgi:hypothetical protein